jgi:hypothetical protein
MRTYKVTIAETLQMTVDVEAPGRREAERLAENRWVNGDHVFDADRFTGVTFKAEPRQKERDYERRTPRTDAERKHVFPECSITASNVFRAQGVPEHSLSGGIP